MSEVGNEPVVGSGEETHLQRDWSLPSATLRRSLLLLPRPGQEAAPHPCLLATLYCHLLLCKSVTTHCQTPLHRPPHPAGHSLPQFTPTSFLSMSNNPLHFKGFIAGSYKKKQSKQKFKMANLGKL